MCKSYLLKIACLFVTLSLSTLSAVAREIKVYVRSVENIALATNAWNSAHKKGANNDTWETPENYGGANDQTASTETIGGKTWYCHTYDLSKLAAEGDTYDQSYFNLQFHTQDGSWWSSGWGIENNSNGTDRLPSELFFVIDRNATKKGTNSWLGIHEITRAQAAETDQTGEFGYYLMDDNGNRIAKFEAVRNQNQGLHTMSGNSFAATIWSDKLFTSGSTTTKFYVKAYYKKTNTDGNGNVSYQYDEVSPATDYEYRPWTKTFDMTPDGNATNENDKDWKHYGDCVARLSNSSRSNYFTLTKKAGSDGKDPVSYTILLNTSNYFDSQNDGDTGNQSILDDGTVATNGAPNNRTIDKRGIGVHPNKILTDKIVASDEKPLYVISNMQDVTRDYNNNQAVDQDAEDWNLTTQYKMTKVSDASLSTLITAHPEIGEAGDEVWSVKINKPGMSALKSIFMAFVSSDDRANLESVVNDKGSDGNKKAVAWNNVIRPFVAEGKDAISMFGGLYRPVNVTNGNQALSPGADDMFYSQCNVYVNLSKSTYFVDPVSSYELTGPAIQYFNPVTKKWVGSSNSQEYWGNGEASYWATPMSYNPDDDCWEYTGKFFTSKCYAETEKDGKSQYIDKFEKEGKQWDGTEGTSNNTLATTNETENGTMDFLGFRFLTNHLYTVNYREDYDRPTATKHHEELNAYWDGTSTDKTGHEDTYYYNHVDIDPDVVVTGSNTTMASAETIKNGTNANREKAHNINFSLHDGTYTIKFYPNGDGKDQHSFYKISKTEDPGTHIPDNHEDDPLTTEYKFLRTYSDTRSHSFNAKNMTCFIVTDYHHEEGNNYATLTSIPYIPANTGVILAYKTTEIENLVNTGKAKQIADGIYQDLGGYMVLDYLDAADSVKYATDSKYTDVLKKNLLRPTTFHNADGKDTDGGVTTEASTFTDNTKKVIKYRNYNFTFYKKKSETNYKLGFYRLKNATTTHPEKAKTSPHRAYLQLPGDVSGDTTPTTQWDQNISFSKEGNLAKAQIYNAFKVEYPDWNDDVPTGIKEIPTDDIVKKNLTVDNNAVYDIAGRVVSTIDALRNGYAKLPKGIYIFNGKKFIVR